MTVSDPLAPDATTADLSLVMDRIVQLRCQKAAIDAEIETLLERLTAAVQTGDLEPKATHDGWTFSLRTGKLTTTYSPEAKAAIERIREADLISGQAIQKRSADSWAITAPKI